MEIFTLNISFPYDEDEEPWSKTIEVREDFTLQNLHRYIQELVEFQDDHMHEFYVGKNPRDRSRALPEKTKLNEIYPLTGKKIYYLFDFGDSWVFQIKKSRKKITESKQLDYPVLVDSSGTNPEQYPDYEE